MSAVELFKTVIFKKKLNHDLNKIIKFSNKIKKQKGRVLSNVGGYQSKDLDPNNTSIKTLVKEITENVNLFSKEILNINKDLYLNDIWLNINCYKDFNNIHNHPFSIISGVFYIKTPLNCGGLDFHNSTQIKCFINDNILKQYNNYNCSKWYFPVQENELYLFPSWLEHSVRPSLSKEERISLSFNFR
jgi:uncharacterized protein (TIGR02466 family)